MKEGFAAPPPPASHRSDCEPARNIWTAKVSSELRPTGKPAPEASIAAAVRAMMIVGKLNWYCWVVVAAATVLPPKVSVRLRGK